MWSREDGLRMMGTDWLPEEDGCGPAADVICRWVMLGACIPAPRTQQSIGHLVRMIMRHDQHT